MQLHTHTHVYWLVHTRVQTCVLLRVMEYSRVSHTVHWCYTKGYTHACGARVDTCMYETLVLPTCSNQSLRRIVSQGAYSSDIVSNYYELVSGVIKILTSREMCKFSRLCFQKER